MRAQYFAFLSAAALCLWPHLLRAQDQPPSDLVIDIAEPIVEIRSFFSGAEIFVFGALECSEPCDVVVIVEGPPTHMIVRRKERVAGIWLNQASRDFATAPGYYAAASTRPLSDILSAEQLRQLGLGTSHLFLSPSGGEADDTSQAQGFRAGLVNVLGQNGLYQNTPGSVGLRGQRLFRAAVRAPAAVPTGDYAITVLTIQKGVVTGTARQTLVVKKAGFEAFVFSAARQRPLIYAVISVALALSIGFISTTIFTRR